MENLKADYERSSSTFGRGLASPARGGESSSGDAKRTEKEVVKQSHKRTRKRRGGVQEKEDESSKSP